jgi:hypothetical protein
MSQDHVKSIFGRFLPVAAAFEGTPEGLAKALKVEIIPVTIVKREPGKKVEQTFNTGTVTTRALIDFAAVDQKAIDFGKLERDCELTVQAIRNHPKEIRQALDLVCSGQATTKSIQSTAAALTNVGITEQAFREQGGGLIGLLIVVAAAMLASSCFDGCPPPVPPEEGGSGVP